MANSTEPPRTYGGWRRSRSMGLLGMGPVQTLVVLAAVAVFLVSAALYPPALAVATPGCLIVIAVNVAKWDGVPLMAGVRERVRFGLGTRKGRTSYRAGGRGQPPTLPGVLAPTTLLTVEDRAGGPFGLVYNRALGTMTATLRCASASTWLADPSTAAAWVANWGDGWPASVTSRWCGMSR